MIMEIGHLVLPPELWGKINTLDDLLQPGVVAIPGPALATLEEKEDYYEFKSDSENITKLILPIWETGCKISFWKWESPKEGWDPQDYISCRPHEAGFEQILKDTMAFFHKVSVEFKEASDEIIESKKVWKLRQSPESIRAWNEKRLLQLSGVPEHFRSDENQAEYLELKRSLGV